MADPCKGSSRKKFRGKGIPGPLVGIWQIIAQDLLGEEDENRDKRFQGPRKRHRNFRKQTLARNLLGEEE
jgi:hypothetical protein